VSCLILQAAGGSAWPPAAAVRSRAGNGLAIETAHGVIELPAAATADWREDRA
jgi:hypothetical protein